MSITLQRSKAAVLLACGGDPSSATGLTVDERIAEIINSAGQQLYHHNWTWRERASTLTLDFTAGSKDVPLPSEAVLGGNRAGNIIKVFPINNNFREYIFVPPATFAEFESRNLNVTEGLFYVTLTLPQAGFGTNSPDAKLQFYPTPQATETDVVGVKFRRNWPNIRGSDVASNSANLTEELPMDESAIPLFLEYIRAFAEGGENGDTNQRVAVIEAGPIYDQALRRDGTQIPNYGPLPLAVRGRSSYANLQFFPNGNIPNP